MPAGQDDSHAAIRDTQLDRLALDRLVFDIRSWWARNPQLRAAVLSDMAGRVEERRDKGVRRQART